MFRVNGWIRHISFRTGCFNRRKSTSRGKLFFRLAQQAVQIDPVPFGALIDHNL